MARDNLKLAVVAGTLFLLVSLASVSAFVLRQTWQSAWMHAHATAEQVATAVEATVNRQLLQVDAALASVPTLLGIASATAERPLTAPLAGRLLGGLNFQAFAFRDLMLVTDDGHVWASARPRSRRQVPADIAVRLSATPRGAGAILGPSRNPATGEWAIYIARAVAVPGHPGMFAVAEVPTAAIMTHLEALADRPGFRVSLDRRDGTLIASLPHDELGIGQARPRAPAPLSATHALLYSDVTVTLESDPAIAMAHWERDRAHLVGAVSLVGVLLCVFGGVVLLGLTQSERLERERLKAQSMLEDAIEAMSDGFVMWDADDRLVTYNSHYLELYKESSAFIKPGARFEDVMRRGAERGQYPQAGEDLERFLQEAVAFHRAGKGSFERLLPDGRWLLVTERRTANGGIVGLRKDITERKSQEATILQYARDLERFSHIASHDLQEPLRKITTHARLLVAALDAGDQEEVARCVDVLTASAQRGRNVVSDLLRFSKLKGRELERKEAHLDAYIAEVVDQVRDTGGEDPVHFEVDLPHIIVRCDPGLVQQAFQNLIGNAMKYRKRDTGAFVSVSCHTVPATGEVSITVRDNGIGFDIAHAARVFEPFQRLVGRTEYSGTGIGLSLVRAIVDKHGWTTEVESARGVGSAFTVTIPARDIVEIRPRQESLASAA